MPPQRRYICSFCARAFSRSEHKARHERSHTKEKPYSCDKCPSAFVRRDLLQRHLRTVHSKDKSLSTAMSAVVEEQGEHRVEYNLEQTPVLLQIPKTLSSSSIASTSSSPSTTTPSDSIPSSTSTTPPRSPVAHMTTLSQPTSHELQATHHHYTPASNQVHYAAGISKTQTQKFNEKNIISLLTLSKKFDKLRYLDLNSKLSSIFLIWGTVSNLHLPIVSNDQIAYLDENSPLLYALLSFGAADSNQFEDCIKLLNKSWLLILKSGNDSNNKVNSRQAFDIIQSLTIISHIYLVNYSTLKGHNGDLKHELIPIEIIMDFLDRTIIAIINSDEGDDGNPLFNYWYVFLILANFSLSYNKKPAACHRFFLSRALPQDTITLKYALDTLSKGPSALASSCELSCDCLIMGLSNELQALKFGQPSFFQTRNFLHNAIIMANKSFIMEQQNHELAVQNYDHDMLSNLVMISKRNLLLNCPLKFQDLIVDYITIPKSKHHWNLLDVTLKEFNFNYNTTLTNQIIQLNSSDEVNLAVLNYLNTLDVQADINNNLGLVSLPMLFVGYIGNPGLKGEFQNFLQLPTNFIGPTIEIYLNLIKIFTSLNSHPSHFNNVIVQSIIYLVSEMGTTTNDKELQEEINHCLWSSSTSPISSFSSSFIKYFTKNLQLNFTSWLSLCYTGANKPELIAGIESSIAHLTNYLNSPLSSHPSSPDRSIFKTSVNKSPMTITPESTSSSPLITTLPPATSSSLMSSSQAHGHDKIKLPPINLPPMSHESRMMLPMPTNYQQYRTGSGW